MTRTCKTCLYWDLGYSFGDRGVCRRLSPRAVGDGGVATWPLTYESDWCGEYSPSDAVDPDNLSTPPPPEKDGT